MKMASLFALMFFVSAPSVVKAQQFTQSPANPLTAATAGSPIDETASGANIHTLNWATIGTPTSCTIVIEMAAAVGGPFITLGTPQNCAVQYGSITYSGTANFVRINLSAFTGPGGASVTYTYVGLGNANFANAQMWSKLDALRAVEALKHGISEIDHCLSNITFNAAPLPSDQEFQLYSEPFGSNFDIAASFGDTGSNGILSAQNSIQTEALAQIEFDSEHFFYDWRKCISHRPTISFGGSVGLRPELVLENLSSTTATIAVPANRPMFQDAFGWNLGPKLNIATSHRSQYDAFVTLGENYLISQVTSFKQGDNTVTATPVSNKVGQSALYWESGMEWKLLNTDIVNAYINKTDVLNPPFSFAVGYRHDNRFKKAGDLSTFTKPEDYMFLRFSIGLNKIVNWSANTVEPGKGYTFKFGIDYEKPIGSGRMPTATRYYVSANVDIMQVFKPSAQTNLSAGGAPLPAGTPRAGAPPPPAAAPRSAAGALIK